MLPKNARRFSSKEAELGRPKSNHTQRLQPEGKGSSAKPGGGGGTPRAASPQGTRASGHHREKNGHGTEGTGAGPTDIGSGIGFRAWGRASARTVGRLGK